MATVVDPLGTPEPVYTRSGTTVQTLAATGTSFGTAAQIVAVSGITVIIADCTDNTERGLILPDDAQIGDVVEIYPIDYFADVYPPTGESVNGTASPGSHPVGQNDGGLFRKVSATSWRQISA